MPDTQPGQARGEDRGEEGGEEARGRRRGRRGGRRRRRDGTDGGPESVAEPGAEQPELPPIYNGPTPANPFGGQAFDIFDVLEQAELAADRPIPMPAHPAPEPTSVLMPRPLAESVSEALREATSGDLPPPAPAPMPDRVAEPAPESTIAESTIAESTMAQSTTDEAAPIPAATPEPTAMTPEPVPAAPAPPLPANDATPEPLVKPILVGADEDAPVAEKKRGWWRH
jgi:ribonuclease E